MRSPSGPQLELPGVTPVGQLGEVLDWWIAHDLDCGPDTRTAHASNAKNLKRHLSADTRVERLRYPALRLYVERELIRGVSRETVRKRLCTLHMALESARRRDLLDRLPPWPVIKTDSRPRKSFWTLSQWERAHAECDDDDFRIWIALAFWTGMRSSDLNRMRWQDVDLWRGTWVRRSTKTRAEPLTLPMPDRLHKILTERIRDRGQPHPRDLVTGRNLGHPNRVLKELCARAGVPMISPHGLRHSCETFLVESGAEEMFRRVWLAHRSSRAAAVYEHPTELLLDRGIAVVNAR